MTRKRTIALFVAAAAGTAWAGSKALSNPQPRAIKKVLSTEATCILAHRGGSNLAPESTLLAFEKAAELGVHGFEIDLRMTKDEHIIVFHDDTVDRTSGQTGSISQMSLQEVQAIDFSERFEKRDLLTDEELKKAKIITLQELLERYPFLYINMDMKDSPSSYEGSLMPSRLWRILDEANALDRVVVTSFYDEQIDRFNLYAQNRVALGAGEKEVRKAYAAYTSQFKHLYHPKADVFQLPVNHKSIRLDTRGFIQFLHSLNIKVHYWTIDDPQQMIQLIAKGADGIVTDSPDLAVELTEFGTK
ncbi:glycerophosphodiester phosphodiesterase [Chryseomicrobium sp. FSL W7-1435]|uniref:glycerophosphodiester phosphodiesterase n=1 Tax=Chryseomicrobium sp. FSL W7-1435 TaxID=2921704 RepID=UPI003159DCB1